jgi:ankyrin repeat protein
MEEELAHGDGLSGARLSTLIRAYVDEGGDPDKQIQGITLLQLALECALCNRCITVKTLVEAGSDPNGRGSAYSFIPLHTAVERQELEVVRLLVDYGANINLPDRSLNTALHTALRGETVTTVGERLQIVEYLLGKGANASLKNSQGQTAYEVAKAYGSEEFVQILEKSKRL